MKSINELKCPHCEAVCDALEDDTDNEGKEAYCGECNEQFGYEVEFVDTDRGEWDIVENDLGEWEGEDFIREQDKYYESYEL